jgi:hypothetical protein
MRAPRLYPGLISARIMFMLALTLTLLIAPHPGGAQMRWSELSGLGLTTIHVIDSRGLETTGVIRRHDNDSLVIMMAGGEDRVFRSDQVTRVERRGDSLKNGALIGAGVGALPALSLLGACSDEVLSTCESDMALIVAISAGVYGLLGAGIDAMIVGRTTVYRGPAPPVRASLSPIVKPSADGTRLGMRVRFR